MNNVTHILHEHCMSTHEVKRFQLPTDPAMLQQKAVQEVIHTLNIRLWWVWTHPPYVYSPVMQDSSSLYFFIIYSFSYGPSHILLTINLFYCYVAFYFYLYII